MPWIELRRAADVGALARRMTFLLDGHPAARLRRGAAIRIEVPPGHHTVQARMDWLRSAPLKLHLDDAASVSITGALPEQAMTFTGAFLRPKSALELRRS
ncbi:hypothetical protein AB0F81_41950 [Actinoplanes sp. NPDC024001]|uniref:hypothetical protein n=1 Tax=Actinoplanes sp. NPDC024001 TaxID=3154598 RepID=UPI0033C6A5BB